MLQPGPDAPVDAGSERPPAADLFARIERRLAAAPIYAALGIHLVHTAPGEVACAMVVTPLHCNVDGILHGGVSGLLADTALGFAVRSTGSDAATNATLHAQMTYHRAGRVGDTVRAEARVVDRAGRMVYAACTLANGKGETLASGTSLNLLREPDPGTN